MIKKYIAILIFSIICLAFTSCTTELYEKNMIKAVGIDKGEDGYEITVRYYPLDSDLSEEKNASAQGASVYEALNKLTLTTGKEQMYSKTSFIIIEDEVAKEGIDDVIDFFIRYFRSRPTVNVYISTPSASEILNTEIDGKLIPSDMINSYTENPENVGKTVSSTIMELISENLGANENSILPLLDKTDGEIICSRSLALKDYKTVLELSEEETKGFLMSAGEYIKGSMDVSDTNDNKISVELYVNSSTLKSVSVGDNLELDLNVFAEIAVVSVPLLDIDLSYNEIEEAVNVEIQNLIKSTIDKSHKNNVDILDLSYYLYMNETDYYRENSENLMDELKTAKININVQSKITRIGEEENPTVY